MVVDQSDYSISTILYNNINYCSATSSVSTPYLGFCMFFIVGLWMSMDYAKPEIFLMSAWLLLNQIKFLMLINLVIMTISQHSSSIKTLCKNPNLNCDIVKQSEASFAPEDICVEVIIMCNCKFSFTIIKLYIISHIGSCF